MARRGDGVSVDVLREAVREQVELTSIREVARDVGMAHTTLADFLKGTEPYGVNRAKLRTWYEGECGELARLRARVAELEKKLAECEKKKRGAG